MSKLIEKLEGIVKGAPQAIGFRAVRTEGSKPRMALIAAVAEDAKSLKDYLAGADAVLLFGKAKASGELPWGKRLEDTGEKAIAALEKSGGDFIVFDTDKTVFTIEKESKLGKIVQIEPSLSDSLLRTVSELPADAVMADIGQQGRLAWNDIMALQRLTGALSKPLLVVVAADLTVDELKAIWNAGVDGIVVNVSADLPADTLAKLSGEMSKLAPRTKKRGKHEPMLPFAGSRTEAEPEHEEEEEEEE